MGVGLAEDADRVEKRLNDHAERIRALEIRDAAQNEKIDTLCTKLGELSDRITDLMNFIRTSLWKAVGALGTVLLVFLSFFIWYVQCLGK
jgi:uncharacterized coiled-coil protein SlyX